jgi:uncharacterized protein YciI
VRGLSAPHHLLLYEYVEDIVERRASYRDAHLAHVRAWKDDGRLVMAGALGDPPTGAALMFQLNDPAEIDEFVQSDPYITAGLVTAQRVRRWNLV